MRNGLAQVSLSISHAVEYVSIYFSWNHVDGSDPMLTAIHEIMGEEFEVTMSDPPLRPIIQELLASDPPNSLNLGRSVLSRHKPGENRGAIGLGSFRFVCLKQTQVGPKIGLVCLDLGSFHNADFGLLLAFKRSSGCNLGRLRWFGFGFDHSIPNPGFAAGQAYWDQRLEPIHRIGFVPADSLRGGPLLKASSRA